MKALAAATLLSFLAACASHPIQPRTTETNATLIAAPTPSEWSVGTVWNFVQFGQRGNLVLDQTFRVTDRPIQTCNSGDWRELEPIDSDGLSEGPKQAYSVSGRLLTLDFSAGWCDVGYIQGELIGGSFAGETTGGPFVDKSFVPNRVVGRRVP